MNDPVSAVFVGGSQDRKWIVRDRQDMRFVYEIPLFKPQVTYTAKDKPIKPSYYDREIYFLEPMTLAGVEWLIYCHSSLRLYQAIARIMNNYRCKTTE